MDMDLLFLLGVLLGLVAISLIGVLLATIYAIWAGYLRGLDDDEHRGG